MRRTPHTAMLAAEQIAAGVDWEKIESEELGSLETMCRAELQDRDYRERRKNQMDFLSDPDSGYTFRIIEPMEEPF